MSWASFEIVSFFEMEFRQCDTKRCDDGGRSVRHFYESVREFLTATGFSYLRPAGRRRRGTILDTSAGAGTCNFSLLFSLSFFLANEGRTTCTEDRTERMIKRERKERGPVFLVFHLRNPVVSPVVFSRYLRTMRCVCVFMLPSYKRIIIIIIINDNNN